MVNPLAFRMPSSANWLLMQEKAIVVIRCDGRLRCYKILLRYKRQQLLEKEISILRLSRSGSSRPSTSRPIVDINVNGNEISNEDYSIPYNEIEENIAFNLNNEEDIIVADRVLPTINEYDMLYNLYNYDLEYDTNVVMQEDDIALDDDIKLDNDSMRGDDEVNGTFEVPIEANCDAHFILDRYRTDSVPIPPTRNESDSQTTRVGERISASQFVSHPSSLTIELS
ncbi:hypothetical protein FNV43_RR27346 [Rhamnella rubrinervis]|uniref:Uncharacterized protein n=1 Tax=Rhamnella rubrinervis TaxID=2594499 RepID=A0A8K0DLG4_9ROSA|nr:hypothetical protein FNV43_RR27346 [Rhamnella rubrinervis]